MALWAIGDFHLSFQVPEKSMDIFGKVCVNHEKKIVKHFNKLVKHYLIILKQNLLY